MRIIDLKDGFDRKTIEALLQETQAEAGVDADVSEILRRVRNDGDAALCEYSRRFDGFDLTPSSMRVRIDTTASTGKWTSAIRSPASPMSWFCFTAWGRRCA